MKRLLFALLTLFACAQAHADSTVRLCAEYINPVTGNVSCIEALTDYTPISISTSTGTAIWTNAGLGTVGVQITSVGTGGTGNFLGSNDNVTYLPLSCVPATGGIGVTSFSATGAYWCNAAGIRYVEVQATALTSGTITGAMYGSIAASSVNTNVTSQINAVGAASFATAQVALTTGGTTYSLAAARTGAPGTGRVSITIVNRGTAVISVGAAGVSTSTGFLIDPGGSFTSNDTAAFYGVSATSGQSVAVFESF